ncbi:hypothetical protein AB0G00_07190 [Nocardia salmonicida]|uniref:hypothetical protein n=1 Tax=Nocardia salmonicida TaxID=53431 RepID=UPI00340CAAD0
MSATPDPSGHDPDGAGTDSGGDGSGLSFSDRWTRITGIAGLAAVPVPIALALLFGPDESPSAAAGSSSVATTATDTPTATAASPPTSPKPSQTGSATSTPPHLRTNTSPVPVSASPSGALTQAIDDPKPWSWAQGLEITLGQGPALDEKGVWRPGSVADMRFETLHLAPRATAIAVFGSQQPTYRDCRGRGDYTFEETDWDLIPSGSYLCLKLSTHQVGFLRLEYPSQEGPPQIIQALGPFRVSGMVWKPTT